MESAIIGAHEVSRRGREKVQFVNIGIGDLLTFLQRDMDFA